MIQGTRLYPESMSYNTRWFNTHGAGGIPPKVPPEKQLEHLWYAIYGNTLLFGSIGLFDGLGSFLCCGFFVFIFSYMMYYHEITSLRLQIPQTKKKAKRVSGEYCLHIDKSSGKKCQRMTYRSTKHCYMHQPERLRWR